MPANHYNWGFWEEGKFVRVPSLPLTLAGFKEPPFTVKTFYGERTIVQAPAEQADEAQLNEGRAPC
jgi:hypothetical protein